MLPWLRDQHANPHSRAPAGPRGEGGGRGRAGAGRGAAAAGRARRVHQRRDRGAELGDQGHGGPIVTIATEHAAVLDTVAAERAAGAT